MRTSSLRRRAAFVALSVVFLVVSVGCQGDSKDVDQAGETAAPASDGGSGPHTYRVVAGEVSYSGQATRTCSYPTGECHDYDGPHRQSSASDHRATEATFVLQGESEVSSGADPMILEALVAIKAWNHTYEYEREMPITPCSVPESVKANDSTLRHQGGSTISLRLGAGKTMKEIDVAVGGMAVPPSTIEEDWIPTGGCGSLPAKTERLVQTRQPFDFYPDAEKTVEETAPTYTLRSCDDRQCVVRAAGTDWWAYRSLPSGEHVTGHMKRRWWFDIEISRYCDGHYSTVEYGAGLPTGDLFGFAASVKWCSDGNHAVVRGQPDGTRYLFPDDVEPVSYFTVPLESLLGIELQEKAGELEVSQQANGTITTVTIDSPGFEACVSPVDILLAAPPLRAAIKSANWSRLSVAERDALLKNIRDTESLPARWIEFADRVSGHGAVLNDLWLLFFNSFITMAIGQTDPIEWADGATDICVDAWDPRVTFTLSGDGTATAAVEHARMGLILAGRERRALETT